MITPYTTSLNLLLNVVATPFFYDTVTFSTDPTSSSAAAATPARKFRFSQFTRADQQQPEIARVQAPSRRESNDFALKRSGDFGSLDFAGFLKGSTFNCTVTTTTTDRVVTYSAFYFANKTVFNQWSSNPLSAVDPLIEMTSNNMTQFSLTTSIDSPNLYLVFERATDTAAAVNFHVDCTIGAMLFDTSKGLNCFCNLFDLFYYLLIARSDCCQLHNAAVQC